MTLPDFEGSSVCSLVPHSVFIRRCYSLATITFVLAINKIRFSLTSMLEVLVIVFSRDLFVWQFLDVPYDIELQTYLASIIVVITDSA